MIGIIFSSEARRAKARHSRHKRRGKLSVLELSCSARSQTGANLSARPLELRMKSPIAWLWHPKRVPGPGVDFETACSNTADGNCRVCTLVQYTPDFFGRTSWEQSSFDSSSEKAKFLRLMGADKDCQLEQLDSTQK